MVLVVVVCGDGDAACGQRYAADDAGDCLRGQAAARYHPCADFARQDMFRGVIHHRVDIRRIVGLHTEQHTLAVVEVIFDDQAVIVVNAHHEVIAAARAADCGWAASAGFGKFIVNVIYGFNL